MLDGFQNCRDKGQCRWWEHPIGPCVAKALDFSKVLNETAERKRNPSGYRLYNLAVQIIANIYAKCGVRECLYISIKVLKGPHLQQMNLPYGKFKEQNGQEHFVWRAYYVDRVPVTRDVGLEICNENKEIKRVVKQCTAVAITAVAIITAVACVWKKFSLNL